MAIATTNENKDHFGFKEVCENINYFYKLKGYNFYVKTEDYVGNHIPDILFFEVGTNKLLGCMECVNYNPMSKTKRRTFKNKNINLWSVKILGWTLRHINIDWNLWEDDFCQYFTEALQGIRNSCVVRTESMANIPQTVFIDGVQTKLVRYEVNTTDIKENERWRYFDVTGYDSNNKSYHLIFVSNKAELYWQSIGKTIEDFRVSNEPIYRVDSEYNCWIDSLYVLKHLTRM